MSAKRRPKSALPSLEYTPRGFAIYGRVTDDRGNVTRVQKSSAVGGPYCYVFTHDEEGREVVPCVGAPCGYSAVSPHLTAAQARELAALLLRFADHAEGT